MSSYFQDLTGQVFTRLTVKSYAGRDRGGNSLWNCVCSCGNARIVAGTHLQSENSKSCGCLRKEVTSSRSKTHGFHSHFLYGTWDNINRRCFNKNIKQYPDYGGRGITVCDGWKSTIYGGLDNQQGFANFIKWSEEQTSRQGIPWDIFIIKKNGKLRDYSLDRIDNDKGYFPENCKWATRKEQQNNRRANIKNHEFNKIIQEKDAEIANLKKIIQQLKLEMKSV